ncbi:hypothetical protein E2C01_067527 [Portunus trituberculatus]|uniref:Uncharacterized protein n=1 Tax=Portunus trituberculatus TaxID=210409 RepID=A0A5B7HTZ6_PORTR|nr:hypothetical protein [Portunus trituberculatus]
MSSGPVPEGAESCVVWPGLCQPLVPGPRPHLILLLVVLCLARCCRVGVATRGATRRVLAARWDGLQRAGVAGEAGKVGVMVRRGAGGR